MRQVLHILTTQTDALANETIDLQRRSGEAQVLVMDLTWPEPDYDELLQAIFQADSIQAW